jgi:hypothetical protein
VSTLKLTSPAVFVRRYLSDKLNCDPMRITKKFTGEACIGKRIFHPVTPTPLNEVIVRVAHEELADLERAFLCRLREQRSIADRRLMKGAGLFARSRAEDDGMECGDFSGPVEWARRVTSSLLAAVTLEQVERLVAEGEAICSRHGISRDPEDDYDEDDDDDDDGGALSDEDYRDSSLLAPLAAAPVDRFHSSHSVNGGTIADLVPLEDPEATSCYKRRRVEKRSSADQEAELLVGFMESMKRQATNTTAA